MKITAAVVNSLTYGAASTSVLGTWLGIVQPMVAIAAGLAGFTLACLQIYDWVRKRRKP